VLLDENVPVQVRGALAAHDVFTVSGLGWKGTENGELLVKAEKAGYDALVLADKNLRYQQNLSSRRIGIVELWTNHRPTLERHFPLISAAVDGVTPGAYVIVSPP
jgi:hypothetical protein